MALQPIEDPVTGTRWLDFSNIPGSVQTIALAVLGFGFLFGIMSLGRGTVAPRVEQVGSMVPGVTPATGDGGIQIE